MNTQETKATNFFEEVLTQTHTLIGGVTGSGKSVLMNGLVYNLIQKSPEEVHLYLIDPKCGVELADFEDLPHVHGFAENPTDAIAMLEDIYNLMKCRYATLKELNKGRKIKLKTSQETPVYVIIDELAVLMSRGKKEFQSKLEDMLCMCRASNIHIIAATQKPSKKAIPAETIDNFTCRIALKCADSMQSKQIIGISGAELISEKGKAFLKTDDSGAKEISFPKISDEALALAIEKWTSFECEEEEEAETEEATKTQTKVRVHVRAKSKKAELAEVSAPEPQPEKEQVVVDNDDKLKEILLTIAGYVRKLIAVIAFFVGYIINGVQSVLMGAFSAIEKMDISGGLFSILIGLVVRIVVLVSIWSVVYALYIPVFIFRGVVCITWKELPEVLSIGQRMPKLA